MKIFNWIATLWRGAVEYRVALLFAAGFIGTFLIGGITGIFLAVFPIDWQLTDTYFVVAHLHYVLVGGAVFTIFAGHLLLVPEDQRSDAVRSGWASASFWLMLIGINVTFLIQHSIGLDGMPRRVYRYPDVGHLELYNQISTAGSFILGIGIVLTAINVIRSLKRGAVAGPDPWKGNTLEWYTTSPPPPNNFDVIPRVRSVEPMKDIRRQVLAQTSAPLRRAAGRRAGGARLMSSQTAATASVRAVSRPRQAVADYVALTKPKVQSLLLLTTVTTMLVAGHPSLWLISRRAWRLRWPPAARARSTTSTTATSTRRCRAPPTGRWRRGGSRRRAGWRSGSCSRRCRSSNCWRS